MVKKIILILVLMMTMINSISAYEMYFIDDNNQKVDELTIYSDSNVFNFKILIDNTDSASYISDSSQLSYLKVKPVGKTENLVTLLNREFRKSGVFIDKDVKEKVEVELRLPLTKKWESSYKIQVAGITTDDRQKIASIIVKPKGKSGEVLTDNLNSKFLLYGFMGLILILVLVFLFDHFNWWKKIFSGRGKNW